MSTLLARRPADTAADPVSIGSVALVVRDLDRVAAFYQRVVGLELIERTPESARLGVDGVAFLELLGRPEALAREPAAAGLYHTAFLLPSRPDLGRWLAHAGSL